MRLINFDRVLVWVGRRRNRPITYEDLVAAETRAFEAEEAIAALAENFERSAELALRVGERSRDPEVRHMGRARANAFKQAAQRARDTLVEGGGVDESGLDRQDRTAWVAEARRP